MFVLEKAKSLLKSVVLCLFGRGVAETADCAYQAVEEGVL